MARFCEHDHPVFTPNTPNHDEWCSSSVGARSLCTEFVYRERGLLYLRLNSQREFFRRGEIVREDVAIDRVVVWLARADVERVRPHPPSRLQILAVDLDAEPFVVPVDVYFSRIAPVDRPNPAYGSRARHLFLLWFRREVFEREQPTTHGNDEFEAYVVRRHRADVLHGETNRPAQSRQELVFGELVAVVRILRPQVVGSDAKRTLIRVGERRNILRFGNMTELAHLRGTIAPMVSSQWTWANSTSSSALSRGLSLPI